MTKGIRDTYLDDDGRPVQWRPPEDGHRVPTLRQHIAHIAIVWLAFLLLMVFIFTVGRREVDVTPRHTNGLPEAVVRR